MTERRRLRLALAVLLWIALAVIGVRTYLGVERRLAVERACEALASGDIEAALAASEPLIGRDAPGLRAAECRALALLESDAHAEAVALLEKTMEEVGGWMPSPPLVLAVAAERRRQGRPRKAVDLLRRATAVYHDDVDLLFLELDTRAEVEDEEEVLLEMERRLPGSGKAAPLLGLRIAQRWAERREFTRAAKLFGDAPPSQDAAIRHEWYLARTSYFGAAGDEKRVAENCRQWIEAGGNPVEVMAWHALTISIYQLLDPAYPVIPLFEQVVSRRGELPEGPVLEKVYRRLIGALIVAGRHGEALSYYDLASRDFDLGMSREEILRSADQNALQTPEPGERRGILRFVIDGGETAGTLLLSAEGDPVDQDYLPFDLRGGFELERAAGVFPVRWVYRDPGGRAAASGTVWPVPGRRLEVRVERGTDEPARTEGSPPRPRLAADGRRRVFVVLLDCADWRFVQYLRARGELPLIDALVRRGRSGVVASRPAYTAVALDALVRPQKKRTISPFGMLHQLGSEIGSNWFVGKNPVAALAWLLPESPTLFETVGAGDRAAVNLLYSQGNVGGGGHGEMLGPGGRRRHFQDWRTDRTLGPEEQEFFRSPPGGLREDWIEEIAAALDAGIRAVEHPEVDLLMLRIAPFDTATHASYSTVSETGQDDGRHALYDLYRYVDHRLAEIYGRIDADDVLIVMSDHGIRTSTEHDWRCIFVAAGETVPRGRLAGTPEIGGVSRLLAELLEVETTWPWAGFETWAE